ncbi:MAG: hypothetical protein H6695_04170 [Deferribacteres bacterium]|nr:hypothetical protein [candidate division KSB1 bacterium]MCB9509348.1 hypothetical protein [Deferribacteres bacterium]
MKLQKIILLAAIFTWPMFVSAQNYQLGDSAPQVQGLMKYEDGVFADTLSSADYLGKILFYNFFGSY